MKKLISLVTLVAVIASFSLCAFADTDVSDKITGNETVLEATDGVYTVEAESTGDYATILAVKGKTIKVGAIQYINQDVTTEGKATFEFALNDDILGNETSSAIDDDVYVLTGGDSNGIKVAGKIDTTPDAPQPTAFTVSGTVSNFVPQEFYDELLVPVLEELFPGENTDAYLVAYKTTAYLLDVEAGQLEEFIGYHVGDVDEFSYVAKADVSTIDGSYAFEEVENGTYAVVIANANALPYMEYAIVEDADVDAGTVRLLAGDLEGSKDYIVDSVDLTSLLDALGEIGMENYNPTFDFAPDCLIDSVDLTEIVENLGDISAYGTDLILEIFG